MWNGSSWPLIQKLTTILPHPLILKQLRVSPSPLPSEGVKKSIE
jgi:hypothetical protein